MSEPIRAQELERAAVSNQLTAKDVEQATKDIQLIKLKSGDALFHQGDAGDSIFFVVSGQLDVTLDVPGGGTCVVGQVGPNSIVGEMSLLLEQPRTANVVASCDTELWKVSRDNFLESISWNERWANQFLFFMAQVLARRLAGMNAEIVGMVAQQQREEAAVQWQQIEALRKHLYSVLEAQDFRGLDEMTPPSDATGPAPDRSWDASLDKSAPRVRAMFSAIAGRYDLLNHLLSANQDVRWRRRAVRLLTPRAGERILDLCCGTGDLAFEILRRQPRCHVTGADFAEPMLDIARFKVQGSRFKVQGSQVEFVWADALHLPFENESFDAVTVAFGVRNFEDTAMGLREMHRVLQPGGRALILEFMRPTSFFLRYVFGVFFKGILPRVGRLISRHNSAYSYLPASVSEFYTRGKFAQLLRECGFRDVRSFDYNFGGVSCFLAKKPKL